MTPPAMLQAEQYQLYGQGTPSAGAGDRDTDPTGAWLRDTDELAVLNYLGDVVIESSRNHLVIESSMIPTWVRGCNQLIFPFRGYLSGNVPSVGLDLPRGRQIWL